MLARYKRLMGFDTFYLTGLDEHGMKIQRKAEELGMTPKEYLDPMAADVQELWKNWIFLMINLSVLQTLIMKKP